MFAKNRQILLTAVFFLDAALLYAAWIGSYALRFYVLPVAAPLGVPPLSAYLWYGAVVVLIALLVLRTLRLYRSGRTPRLGAELAAIAQGMTIVMALAALGSFFLRGELARSVLLLFAVTGTTALWLHRILIRLGLRALRQQGRNLRHVLIVGTGPLALAVARKMNENPDFGFEVKGLVAARAEDAGAPVGGIPVLGRVADFPALAERAGAELVYLALGRAEWEAEQEALDRLSDSTVAVRLVPDLARAFTINASVEDFDGTPVVLVTESPEQGWNQVVKRAFDLVCSAVGLVLLSPLFLALAVWVKLDSPGPVFYAQERVGMNGRRFRMLKFRTMRVGSDAGGPQWTTKDDPRRTRGGSLLRRLSLDELPQLWNVFLGEMSLVGPRPEQPAFVEQFRGSIPRYMLRHHMKAGITGWAQVNGLRGDTPLERRIEYDLYYIQHWSLFFDIRILARTIARVFRDPTAI
ncbi:MAG TPA: undecaprenyl-phosphate glucose phosphotransferase [Candidatus Eisenbacteria bacterium]|nr:undecaprenyl-phosphate glucose phosphotransferase [Candidatus Eisenbacteria bacterium]